MVLLSVAACSDDEDDAAGGGGDACSSLCTGAGFGGGAATTFERVVTECVCTGTSSSGGVKKADCEGYCAPLGVAAAKSFVSENASPNDKCVCDGT